MKDWSNILRDRRMEFMDVIEEHGSIGGARLQNLLHYGDGTFYRTKKAVLELYPEDIHYNKRTKLFTTIKAEIIQEVIQN